MESRRLLHKVGMRRHYRIVCTILMVGTFGCGVEPDRITIPEGAEMLFWEWQSWETGGGRNRLTIWKDGRSQVVVVPDAYTRRHPEKFHAREGWKQVKGPRGISFVQEPAFPEDEAREKFRKAFEAGIHLLQTFGPDYVDGSGTVVGIQIDGKLKETVIPVFVENNQGTTNHKRFLDVSKILADFPVDAYDLKN